MVHDHIDVHGIVHNLPIFMAATHARSQNPAPKGYKQAIETPLEERA